MEHGMKNMKMAKSEGKEAMDSMSKNKPQYPYGLKLNLNHEAMEKLGMKDMPEMGKSMMMTAKVMVTDMHTDGANKNMGLQITDMAFEDEKEPLEKRLYPEKK